MIAQILNAADSPRELEALYRLNPREFTRDFAKAFSERPDSMALRVWNERLFFAQAGDSSVPASGLRAVDIRLTIALALIAGTLAKIPLLVPEIDPGRFLARNLAGVLVGTLIAYFCVQRHCRLKMAIPIFGLLAGAVLYLNLLPGPDTSQTSVLACLHAPFFFWSLLGVAFVGGAWRNLPGRMDYLRYNGELLVFTTVVLIGGMVLTGLTFALFGLIDVDIRKFYMENVVIYGAVGAPIVATLLVEKVVGNRFKITPLLAKVFTPLFLATTVAYLIAMIVKHKSPFTDRDFLIAFNGLLLVVLGLCIFSISERRPEAPPGLGDLMSTALVWVTLVIDVIALAAILFRLTSYGFSPNRLAVLGANLLAFCHLAGIFYHYIRFLRKNARFSPLENWIVGYLPAYAVWSLAVVIGFPLVFWFR